MTPNFFSVLFMRFGGVENGQYTTCVLANLPAEAVDSPRRADEIGSRLADLERILSESRASLAAAATADAEADRGALLHATLQRVARFTALLQSSLTRNDADAVDRLVVQLLLERKPPGILCVSAIHHVAERRDPLFRRALDADKRMGGREFG